MNDLADTTAPHASVLGLYTAAAAGQPMQEHAAIEAVAGVGLAGDRYAIGTGHYSPNPRPDGGREITIFASEVRDRILEEAGVDLPPGASRRNVETFGIDLGGLIGAEFNLGEVVCRGVAPCTPCRYLEQVTGLEVLKPLVNRGGLRATILRGGVIRVGDPVIVPQIIRS